MPADAIGRLSAIFERLGMEFEVEHVREALWLAQHNIELSDFLPESHPKPETTAAMSEAGRKPVPTGSIHAKDAHRPRVGKKAAETSESNAGGVRIYAQGSSEEGGETVKASPISLPAASALPGSLPIARALRPFAHRWPSAQVFELDEEASVTATAEQGGQITAVMRPLQERWFEVNVVYETSPSMLVWADTIHEFTALLERTGLFRDVRQWKLDVDRESLDQAFVISPQGARLRAQILASPPRRSLILFATHGLSPHWRDGAYRRLLTNWARTASIAIVQTLPQRFWMRTELGEPSSFARAVTPGAPTSELLIETPWWEFADDDGKTATFPLIALESQTIHRWARAQMGKADRALAVALAETTYVPEIQKAPVEEDAETLVAYFHHTASPEACELAVYLSSSAFTLPVARLIQSAKFGSAAQQSHLAEVLMSGLLRVRGDTISAEVDPNAVYYEFLPETADVLRRALRQEDARFLASTLEEHVSAYLQAHLGRPVSFRALIRDKDGNFDLPAWAQPFAELGAALLGLPAATAPTSKYDRFVASAGEAVLHAATVFAKAVLRGARRVGPSWAAEAGDMEGLAEPLWALFLEYGFVSEPHLGLYDFPAGVLELLADSAYDRDLVDASNAYELQRLSVYFACSHPELRPLRDQISAGLARRGFRMLQDMPLQMSHLIQAADTYLQVERRPGAEVLGEPFAIAQEHAIKTRMVYTDWTEYAGGFNVNHSDIEETIQHMFVVIGDHARHDPGALVGVPPRANRAAPPHPDVSALREVFYSSGKEVAAVFSSDGYDARSLVIDFVHELRASYGVSWGHWDGRWPLQVYDSELPSNIRDLRRAILLDPHPDLFLEDERFPSYDGPPLEDGGSRYIATLRRALFRFRGKDPD